MSMLEDKYYKFGREKVGPFVKGFTGWIHQNCKEDKIKTIIFLSRDGFLYYKYFSEQYANNYDIHYFCVSKKSLAFPFLYSTDNADEICKAVFTNRMLNISDFGKQLGLDYDKINCIVNFFGIDPEHIYNRENENDIQYLVKVIKAVKKIYKEEIKEQYNLFVEYYLHLNIKEKCALVDIGWRGTSQYMIESILHRSGNGFDILGLYVGIDPLFKINARGYLFCDRGEYRNEVMSAVALLEMFGMQLVGTTIGYIKEHGLVYPVISDFEFQDQDSEINCIELIQRGAMDYSGKKGCDVIHIISHPDKNIWALFNDWMCYGTDKRPLIIMNSWFSYISNPRKLLHDFNFSSWKAGFLYSFFRNGSIAFNVYCILKKIFG